MVMSHGWPFRQPAKANILLCVGDVAMAVGPHFGQHPPINTHARTHLPAHQWERNGRHAGAGVLGRDRAPPSGVAKTKR